MFIASGLTCSENFAHCQFLLRTTGVERTGDVLFGGVNHPCGEIADINDLDGIVLGAGRENFAAALNSQWPIREAIGGIAGPDDEAGANDGSLAGMGCFGGLFAKRLQATVILVFISHGLDRGIIKRGERGGFIGAEYIVFGIAGNAGDVDVLLDARGEKFRGGFHHAGVVATVIKDGVPLADFKRFETIAFLGIAIANEAGDFAGESADAFFGLAAIEDGDGVAAGLGSFNEGGAKKACAAEDENAFSR